MDNMFILDETQIDRDKELASLLGLSLQQVEALPLCAPKSIQIFDQTKDKPKDITSLYSNYEYMDFPAYLRTLMFTSITRRHKELIGILRHTRDSVCLDFGSGCGSHTIALLQTGNTVVSLDVPGKLQDFAKARVASRGLSGNFVPHTCSLLDNHYDLVICSDTLEHVPDPLVELKRLKNTLKPGGLLHLLVSTMVKPSSGHFPESIAIWKKDGKKYLKQNFSQVTETIWVKK